MSIRVLARILKGKRVGWSGVNSFQEQIQESTKGAEGDGFE